MTADLQADRSAEMAVSVVIITYRRPENVRVVLEHLQRQTAAPQQVLVVDASPGEDTQRVVGGFPFATYLRNRAGAGNMTSSRNEALPLITGEVVAFLDDDAYPAPDYVQRVAAFYAARPEVALGCSRTLNGVPGEDGAGLDRIGLLLHDGSLTGNFAADPRTDLPIDHGIGATMSMRIFLLRELGGFRELYTGISGVREDADLFLRAKALGHQAWFLHAAVARHVAAPQERGQRFDLRYRHWSSRNHTILLAANIGMCSGYFLRAVTVMVWQHAAQKGGLHKRVVRTLVGLAGIVRGGWSFGRRFGTGPRPPVGGYRQGGRPLRLPPP